MFRSDLAKQLQPTAKYTCISLIVFSLMLDLGIYKWRKLTNYIIYIECLYQISLSVIPNDAYIYWNNTVLMINMVGFIMFYTDTGMQIISLTCN